MFPVSSLGRNPPRGFYTITINKEKTMVESAVRRKKVTQEKNYETEVSEAGLES